MKNEEFEEYRLSISVLHSPFSVDALVHPRNLNLMLMGLREYAPLDLRMLL